MLPIATASNAVDLKQLLASTKDVTLNVGAGWPTTLSGQTIYLEPDLAKAYTEASHTKSFFSGGIFAGLQREVRQGWLGQLGLEYATTTKVSHSGDVWEDADPTFNNYTYGYDITHSRVSIKGLLIANQSAWFARPYASASIGLGFNNSRNFQTQSKLYQEPIEPGFSNHSNTSFAYTLGVGVQSKVVNNCSVGLGYEFSDWGSTHLGSAQGQTINQGIAYSHLYNNAVMFNFSYTA